MFFITLVDGIACVCKCLWLYVDGEYTHTRAHIVWTHVRVADFKVQDQPKPVLLITSGSSLFLKKENSNKTVCVYAVLGI